MKSSRTVSYAVHAILALAQDGTGRPVACREIADSRGMPQRFLLQILRNLVAHGILVSVRGVDGGYALKRSVQEITLLSLIEAVEGPICGHIPTGVSLSETVQANLRRICEEIAAATRLKLAAVTLADLVNPVPAAQETRDAVQWNVAPLAMLNPHENGNGAVMHDGR